jgi:hypothetical protein
MLARVPEVSAMGLFKRVLRAAGGNGGNYPLSAAFPLPGNLFSIIY